MSAFRLSGKALRDVADIIGYQHRNRGASTANAIESRLFTVFRDIAESPAMGHRRSDLTPRNIMFYYAQPYFILFRRMKQRTQVLRVAHESQDLKKFL